MTLSRFTVAPFLMAISWATFENIEFSFNFKNEPILSMSVEQKNPTWGFKNFKYEVGLSNFINMIK